MTTDNGRTSAPVTVLDRIDRALDWWSRALMAVAIVAGAAMMVNVSFDVFMRTVFHAPLRQTNQTVAAYYMIAAAFLPIALLGRRDDHISADVFTSGLPWRTRRWTEAFTLVLGLLYMTAFTWQAWISAARRTAQNEVLEISGGFMPVWPGRWILPIAGASLFLCFGMRLIRTLMAKTDPGAHHSQGTAV